MAEERNVGIARATEAAGADLDPTKAELQRRMEEARESISQTVTEIKDTVVTQYQQVKETISDSLDWREQYRRHTLPFTVGAFAAGALLGYGVMGAFRGGSDGDEDYDDEGAFDRIEDGFDQGLQRSYAASPITGARRASSAGGSSSSAYQRTSRPESNAATESAEVFGRGYSAESDEDVGPAARPSYSSGYQAATAQQAQGLTSEQKYSQEVSKQSSISSAQGQEEEPKGPGLIERFKETKAYDRLQQELATMGDRVVEELSKTAQNVVLPALLGKLKDMIGIDLSTQREVAQRSRLEQQTAQARTQADRATGDAAGSAGSGAYQTAGGTATP